jgi:hypothetical protein
MKDSAKLGLATALGPSSNRKQKKTRVLQKGYAPYLQASVTAALVMHFFGGTVR